MVKKLLLAIIRGYRFVLSPWLGNSCRYWPTCSEYAMDAIFQHGALRGAALMLARLARCHPYGAGGVDPVPARFSWRCLYSADCGAMAPRQTVSSHSIESDHGH